MSPDRLQYFLEHFWNDQKCVHLDPRTPYLSSKYFKSYKKMMGTSSCLMIWICTNVGRYVYLFFIFHFLIFETLKMKNIIWEIWKSGIQNADISSLKFESLKFRILRSGYKKWQFGNLKIGNFEIVILKIENLKIEHWDFEKLKISMLTMPSDDFCRSSIFDFLSGLASKRFKATSVLNSEKQFVLWSIIDTQ